MKRDKKYCNVDRQKIEKAKPIINERNIELLYKFITERYKIHLKKDVEGKSGPWTKDSILKEFRFTNVKRIHDRETIWAIKNICKNKDLSYGNKLLNCILFRLYNKSETSKIIEMPIDFTKDFNGIYDYTRDRIVERIGINKKYVFYTNAFNTGGMKAALGRLTGEEFVPFRPLAFIEHLIKFKIVDKITRCSNQKMVFDLLSSLKGIGNFLAYQMFVDFSYIDEFPFTDKEFVVCGPGCVWGLKNIFDDFDLMNYDESVFWLKDNQNKVFEKFGYNPSKLFIDLNEEEQYLDVMSLENCMCEISKYIRAYDGEGRPRNKYKTHGDIKKSNILIDFI